jgi:hypothetical protein
MQQNKICQRSTFIFGCYICQVKKARMQGKNQRAFLAIFDVSLASGGFTAKPDKNIALRTVTRRKITKKSSESPAWTRAKNKNRRGYTRYGIFGLATKTAAFRASK